ncbi:MAG: T9SS type A sorting domain-containing protein, partial [Bacteroidales bacterium]
VVFNAHANVSSPEGTLVDLYTAVEDGHWDEADSQITIGQSPEIIIGDGSSATTYYPFYNWYKANRSQMLYKAEEIGLGEKTIKELGMDFVHLTSTPEHQVLPNFKILIKHTDISSVGSSYVNMDDAVLVFDGNNYQMPTEDLGWHMWDIEDFEYDGESNLIIEVIWGLLDSYCQSGDYYSVNGTDQGENRVAYGYDDNQSSPDHSDSSSLLPNLYLTFAADDIAEEKGVTFIVNDTDELIVDNAKVQIGSLAQYTNEQGVTAYQLYPGEYSYLITKEQHQDNYGTFSVSDQDVTVNVTMLPHGTDVTDLDDEFGLVVYPNPTRNLINVQLNAQDAKVELELINYLGQIVERTSVNTATGQTELQFNLNGLAKGLYYLKADIDGEVITKKIILQ